MSIDIAFGEQTVERFRRNLPPQLFVDGFAVDDAQMADLAALFAEVVKVGTARS